MEVLGFTFGTFGFMFGMLAFVTASNAAKSLSDLRNEMEARLAAIEDAADE